MPSARCLLPHLSIPYHTHMAKRRKRWLVDSGGRKAVACLLIVVVAGCNAGPFGGSSTLYDAQSDQPLGADGRRVKMKGSASWDFVKIDTQMEWVSGEIRRDPFKVAEEIERFFARPEPRPNSEAGTDWTHSYTYPDTRTIVCIEPIVVVVTTGETEVDQLVMNGWIRPHGTAAWFKWGNATVYLPHGYQYGTRVRADGDLWWYSPTLKVRPTSLTPSGKKATIDISSEGHRRSLSLIRQGIWWRVREGDPG